MDDIFTIINNKIQISPENLSIPEFLVLWERDTTRSKEKVNQEFLYIYHLCNPKSIYRNYPQDKQEELVRKAFIKIPDWLPDEIIQSAINKYKEGRITHTMRFLDSCIFACNKIIDYFNGIDFEERDDSGKAVYKLSEVTSALEKTGKILQNLETLQEKVNKELNVNNNRIRGGGDINAREE
jgi:hypothetical protein